MVAATGTELQAQTGGVVTMLTDLQARFRAVAELQALRDSKPAGSWSFETLDHAINLALEPRRAVNQYLTRNLVRDSRRVISRRRRAGRLALATDVYGSEHGAAVGELETAAIDLGTPVHDLEASDLLAQARRALAANRRGALLIDLVLEGYTTREIAAELNVSPAYASKLAQQVKDALESRDPEA